MRGSGSSLARRRQSGAFSAPARDPAATTASISSCGRRAWRRTPWRRASASRRLGASDELMTTTRISGHESRRSREAEARVGSGSRGSMSTTCGRGGASATASSATRRRVPTTSTPSPRAMQAREALADAWSSRRRGREAASGRAGRGRHAASVGRRHGAGSDGRPVGDATGSAATSSGRRRRWCTGRGRHAPRRLGVGHDDLDRRPLPGHGSRPDPSRRSVSARVRMPASPRWPRGPARIEPAPSSSTSGARPPRPVERDLASRARRVLDDVVERLLGDPVQGVLDVERQPLVDVASSTVIGQPVRPWTPAACVRSAWTRPSSSRLPGRSSKISARISASASAGARAARPASRRPRRVASQEHLDAARGERHAEQRLGDRVVQLPREVGALLARRELGSWRRRSRSSRSRSLMSRAEPWARRTRRRRRHPGSGSRPERRAHRDGQGLCRATWTRAGSAIRASQRSTAVGSVRSSTMREK